MTARAMAGAIDAAMPSAHAERRISARDDAQPQPRRAVGSTRLRVPRRADRCAGSSLRYDAASGRPLACRGRDAERVRQGDCDEAPRPVVGDRRTAAWSAAAARRLADAEAVSALDDGKAATGIGAAGAPRPFTTRGSDARPACGGRSSSAR